MLLLGNVYTSPSFQPVLNHFQLLLVHHLSSLLLVAPALLLQEEEGALG
jgi:hypothetical protein